jgi:NAD(P)-dependent dehydrogenase (short-subunit alcohol dehydrogenase family)
VVIVAGGSGIGLGAAAMLAAIGAEVVIAGRNSERLGAAARAVRPSVRPETVDAASSGSQAAFFARIGAIDHLVLGLTGRLGGGAFASLPLGELRRGSLTFVTGISARKVNPGGGGFAALNGALEAMTPTLARELAPLRVNAVSPGLIRTRWYDLLPKDERRETYGQAAARLPVGRVGTPEDVARAALRPRHAVRHRLDHRMRRRRAVNRRLSNQ